MKTNLFFFNVGSKCGGYRSLTGVYRLTNYDLFLNSERGDKEWHCCQF